MPVALRHSITCQYLNPVCEWVADLKEAYQFPDTTVAERFCRQRGLGEVDLLLVFEDGPYLVFHLD
jgi:hypothetical protein